MLITPFTSSQTIEHARNLVLSGRGAVLQDLLDLIQTLSSKAENLSIHELTDILEKDPIIVSRVLSAANTVRNNPGISPLSSLSHAVHQVGFQKVRSIAVSMMLLEGAAGATNCAEQRDAAALALCAGLISRSCAANLGYADPDLLFACGMLRNLGAVLMPAISPAHCREAKLLAATLPTATAYQQLFGLTPLELSREMVSSLRMPKEITFAMEDCYPETMSEIATHQSGRILGIAEFSSQLAELALSRQGNPAHFAKKSRVLAKRFYHTIPDAAALIPAAMEHSHEQLSALTRHGNFLPPDVFTRIRAHAKLSAQKEVEETCPTTVDATCGTLQATESVATAAAANSGDYAVAKSTTLDLQPPVPNTAWPDSFSASAVFELQHESPASDASNLGGPDPWMDVLSTIQQLMQADGCATFLGRKQSRRATLHRWTDNSLPASDIPPVCTATERTVFGVCLARHETVLIHNGLEASLDNYLPDWMRKKVHRPGAFLLLALGEEQAADGFIYLAWNAPRHIVISQAQANLIRSLIEPHLPGVALTAGF